MRPTVPRSFLPFSVKLIVIRDRFEERSAVGIFASVMRALARLAGTMAGSGEFLRIEKGSAGSDARTRYGDFFKLILAGLLRDSVMLRCALWCSLQRERSAKWLILLRSFLSSRPTDQKVGSSNLSGRTKEIKGLPSCVGGPFVFCCILAAAPNEKISPKGHRWLRCGAWTSLRGSRLSGEPPTSSCMER